MGAKPAHTDECTLAFFLESIIYRLRNTLNGNRPSWSFAQSQHAPTRAHWQPERKRRNHPHTHARTLAHRPALGSAPARIGRPISSGVVGNTTLIVAASLGGAVALLLVVVIIFVLRSRRSARATDPAPGLRTPLYGE
jgi:hypothetical protein